MSYPCYAELKMDGEFCVADMLTLPESGLLIGKNGKARVESPILKLLPLDTIILGELHYGTGKAGALYSLLSNATSEALNFAAFDIVYHEGRDIAKLCYEERRELLLNLIDPHPRLQVVETYYCEDPSDVNHVLELSKGRGFEGIVVKSRGPVGSNWVKIKHTETADLPVVFIDPDNERIEVEVGVFEYNPNAIGNRACIKPKRVGVKVTDKIKQTLNIGDIVEIEHYGVLNGGGLRHPMFKRVRHAGKRVSID